MNRRIAKIAVSAATYHIDKPFDYLVNDDVVHIARPGMRVIVPFGRGDKKVEGIILSLEEKSSYAKLKAIEMLLDDEPVIDEENIKLAFWMSDRFFCSIYDSLRVMLPVKMDFKRKIKGRETSTVKIQDTVLTNEQSVVFNEILPLLYSQSPKAALLYGVTGSGKTQVYIKLIEATLKLGKTAIVLVPEIALTPQTVSIFEAHFGDTVAVLHSGLGDGERYSEWSRIRAGTVKLVVGTRSAVFAPLKNIGLIVIDEEQEHTYKSENSPRYHARMIAKHKVTDSKGLLLMASATPSIDSMYMAKNGKYSLFHLSTRFNEMKLPSVIVVDMKKELKNGNGSSISSVLRDELSKNISNAEQSILFINRRGASPVVACGECGYTYKCKHCSVSMTYHVSNKRLLCHYCGYHIPVPHSCVKCAGKLKFIGVGTQKVELELAQLFPDVNIIRMDADTTSRKNSHKKLLSDFRNKEAQILLGTQMVTKGLDFENVTLVGVLSADLSLYMSDYRANEKTFSLITQVVGRSGRGEKPGRAVIQTFTPQNKVISLASMQDYYSFYESEIELRKLIKSPPVRDLISLTVTGIDENKIISACELLKKMLCSVIDTNKQTSLLGPAPAAVSKVSSKYVYKLLICCKNNKFIRDKISQVVKDFLADKKSNGLTVYADVDMG